VERDVPLIRRIFASIALFLCAIGLPHALAAEDGRLVLVASAHSPLAALSPSEVRRLYLGMTLTHSGREIVALRNAENPVVREKFLQHVLFMSAQAYERQISARLYRAGGNRIPEFTAVESLLESLAADPLAVTYMQADSAARRPGIKVLAEL
jgi:hypothetical protein